MLAQIRGWVARADGREIYIDDGSGQVLVYIDADTKIRWPRLNVGDPAIITGIVTRFRNAPEILPRYQSDVQFAVTLLPVAGANLPAFLNQLRAQGYAGEDLAIARRLHAVASQRMPKSKTAVTGRAAKSKTARPQAEAASAQLRDGVTLLSFSLLAAAGVMGMIAAHKYRTRRGRSK